MNSAARPSSRLTRWLIPLAMVVLLGLMVADTTFLGPEAASAVNEPEFNAESFSAETFPEIATMIQENATDVVEFDEAYTADPAAAGEQYGLEDGGTFLYQLMATGTVSSVDEDFMEITVPGLPPEGVVRVPLGSALSGTPIRDATGTLKFGDFPSQTDYQSVANQFKLLMQSEVLSAVDPASLQGNDVSVAGVYSGGGPANAYLLQPVSIKVAS